MNRQSIEILDQIVTDAVARGAGHLHTEDETLTGRTMTVGGRELVNFGSCSYLGLERHPALIEGTIDAVRRYGTQFSSSRSYTSLGLYAELEDRLQQMYGRPAVVSATTTLGHLASLPVLVDDADAIVLDHQVHSSVQMAAQQLKAQGVPVTIVRHNHMGMLERKVRELKAKHRKVWYLADGIYSMYGDSAPLEDLTALLDRHPQLNLYIDDAHGMSWTGDDGVGHVWSSMPHHERMVLAVSLNKAFATAGGALILPDQQTKQLIRNCGPTLMFSGPIQPPMLGAALASAKLHQSAEIVEHQTKLAARVAYMNGALEDAGLPQLFVNDSPLFFVAVGLPKVSYRIAERMVGEGFYLNSAVFPAVPMKRGGMRFTVTNHLDFADIDRMVPRLAHHYLSVLAEEGSSVAHVAQTFKIPAFEVKTDKAVLVSLPTEEAAAPLQVQTQRTIDAMDPTEWDGRAAGRGSFTHSALQRIEAVFGTQGAPAADRWRFEYITVRDEAGAPILSTFFTVARTKDDMFAPASVSEAIEAQRASDPEHLTSLVVLLGSLATNGHHLWLDRDHPRWRDALGCLVDRMQAVRAEHDAAQVLLRDFVGDKDEALTSALLELGLTCIPLPDNHAVEDLGWADHDGYVRSLSSRYRSDLRREVLKHADAFEVVTGPMTTRELERAYALYEEVYAKSHEISVHKLPFDLFSAMAADDAYDVLRLYVGGEMAAVMFSHAAGGAYHAMFVGLDYRFVESLGAYKQVLYRTVLRAHELGAEHLDLAFTARLAKRKIGARARPAFAYVQVMDHFNASVIESMSQVKRSA